MKRTIALLGAVAALAVVGIGATTSAQEQTQDRTPNTCDGHVAKFHKSQAKGIAKAIYATRKWQDSTPAKKGQHAYFRWHVQCLYQPRADRALRAFKKAQKATFYKWRIYRLAVSGRVLGGFAGCSGAGKWLRYTSVPGWVVSAESGCSWTAVNGSSGACGPYQLLSWTSCDTSSFKDKMRHHRIAGSLPDGSWAVGY